MSKGDRPASVCRPRDRAVSQGCRFGGCADTSPPSSPKLSSWAEQLGGGPSQRWRGERQIVCGWRARYLAFQVASHVGSGATGSFVMALIAAGAALALFLATRRQAPIRASDF